MNQGRVCIAYRTLWIPLGDDDAVFRVIERQSLRGGEDIRQLRSDLIADPGRHLSHSLASEECVERVRFAARWRELTLRNGHVNRDIVHDRRCARLLGRRRGGGGQAAREGPRREEAGQRDPICVLGLFQRLIHLAAFPVLPRRAA